MLLLIQTLICLRVVVSKILLERSQRTPQGDALQKAKDKGYSVIDNKADFMALKPTDGKVIAWNSWLQDGKALPYVMDMTEKDITLPEFTKKSYRAS